jgi:FAD/FMN-containing dehydrogenase
MTETDTSRIGEATIAEFAAGLRGTAVRPGDADYDRDRSVWNGAHDRHPAIIARCAGVADVMRTIEFARSEGLALSVRGGGHSIAGFSTNDGGVVLDLSPMKGIQVDPVRRRVIAQAGCLWQDLDPETQLFGLAVTGGLVSTTGIAGFTLGGGIGWLVRKFGMASDNLVGADVVTSDGQFIHTSADEHPELFWALHGGGGNFGVVTSFEFALHEVGPTVFSGIVFYPADEAERVIRGYQEACRNAPDELTTVLNLTTAPPVPFLPQSVHGKPILAVLGCYAGDMDAADTVTATFRSLGTVITDVFAPHPYAAWQQAIDGLFPRGVHNYFRSAFVRNTNQVQQILQESFATLPTPLTEIHVHQLGGAMNRIPADATAFAMRDQDFIVNVVARTPTAEGFGDAVEWARGVTDAMGQDAATYVNFTGEGSSAHVRAAYPAQTYQRLVAAKNEYDPSNLFRLNQNIAPTG